ncbi:glycosyltransferase [Eubacterium sp.]|uniref:glycosyltransferase n=1 Tax=Eubacterium sp. TaxID=142586 RepID=UPI0025FAF3B9|nr:glycosyltransferase [Eubacterium sp.]MCR5629809.1 glycosyltransferase [Eubacterium sp.]
MKIVQINQTANLGSTGKIMFELNDTIKSHGHEGYMVSAYSNGITSSSDLFCINSNPFWAIRKDLLISRISGLNGYRYKKITQSIIKWVSSKKPDIIHLHNIHGDWINLKAFFDYLKKSNIPVVWTLHDCWAFTGRCSHFESCKCDKWMSECCKCTNKSVYPVTYFFDKSSQMYNDKKEWFTSLDNMTIVTPSRWLANYVEKSFLSKYDICVIPNGINTDIFHPQDRISQYYEKYNNKRIILGVASSWDNQKGFNDFIKLDSIIDHKYYQIVMVGLNNRQINMIPKTIKGIKRTNNQKELAELYSGAKVFVNLTYQDNYPTTNIESQCCGTPCITYKTGGSPESILCPSNVINQGDIEAVHKRICEICDSKKNDLLLIERNKNDKMYCFEKYINLYSMIYEKHNSI